ncbi:cytochrome P450 [Microcystis aeruginosa]|uniref:Biotin biosynthesis cytochrome P450 n=1 Tax=Microcystis aeruginosa NIES-2521 TaxID=2303983 RepID=A0A5A5S3M8_MICAE|nr:cytochrome P450 [Microcystis aeruginosa]GCA80052.1 biotin biosynthesis cytochrome P450 [Microcystis aeruginosa NIES-2521]
MNGNKVLFNPFDAEFQANPYPVFAQLRQEDPIHKSIFGTWIITRYADALTILNDKRFQVDNLPERLQLKSAYLKEDNLDILAQTTDKWLFFLEPPDHTRIKNALIPSFSRASLNAMRPKIQAIVDDLLDRFAPRGEMEIIADFATPLPALAITKILGLPIEDYQQLMRWSAKTVFIFDQPVSLEEYKEQNQILIEHRAYFAQKVAEYKRQPNDGLISQLANYNDNINALTEDEIISTSILLIATSQESMKGLLSNGLLALLKHPQSLEYVRQNPGNIENIVEELLRYDSPIQYVSRRAIEDVEVSGKIIHRGEYVVIYLGAVNHDPEYFSNPQQLDFSRRKPNLGFGGGLHYCIGMFLARLQVQIALNAIVQRLPDICLNTDKLDWCESKISRRLKTLPVKFTPLA